MNDNASRIGLFKCAQWLSFCLLIGYEKEDLDELEKLFWKYKDKNGNLKPNQPCQR